MASSSHARPSQGSTLPSQHRRRVVARAPSSTRSTCAASPTPNGDGTGDLAGVRAHLPYLAELGIDALWFNPWYPSPLADAGYDISDYRSIDPLFGTLAEAEPLIAEAHALGIRTIIDIVPNHVSTSTRGSEALAAAPGLAERERFWFRPGPRRARRPAAERLAVDLRRLGLDAHGRRPTARPANGTCTCSPPSSPTSTGAPESVHRARGHAALLVRPRRRRRAHRLGRAAGQGPRRCPTSPGPAGRAPVHGPRRVARRSTAPGARSPTATPSRACWSARSGCRTSSGSPRYLRPDELHTAFNFDFLACPWDAAALRVVIDAPSRATRRWTPRPPGCSRTTTSPRSVTR